jgi:hypothetical protein
MMDNDIWLLFIIIVYSMICLEGRVHPRNGAESSPFCENFWISVRFSGILGFQQESVEE